LLAGLATTIENVAATAAESVSRLKEMAQGLPQALSQSRK